MKQDVSKSVVLAYMRITFDQNLSTRGDWYWRIVNEPQNVLGLATRELFPG